MDVLSQKIEQLRAIVNNPAKQLEHFIKNNQKVVGCFPEYT